jgi:hypothetical protein
MTSEQVQGINFFGMPGSFEFGVVFLERALSCAVNYRPPDIGSTPLSTAPSYSRDRDSGFDSAGDDACCKRLLLI